MIAKDDIHQILLSRGYNQLVGMDSVKYGDRTVWTPPAERYFLAYTSNGQIAISTNGETDWSVLGSCNVQATDTTKYANEASSDDGTIVAVINGKLYYSNHGKRFTAATSPVSSGISAVCYATNMLSRPDCFFAVYGRGENGRIYSSADGITWEREASDITIAYGLYDVICVNGKVYAVGGYWNGDTNTEYCCSYRTDDGETWVQCAAPASGRHYKRIVYRASDNKFFLFGGNNTLAAAWYSSVATLANVYAISISSSSLNNAYFNDAIVSPTNVVCGFASSGGYAYTINSGTTSGTLRSLGFGNVGAEERRLFLTGTSKCGCVDGKKIYYSSDGITWDSGTTLPSPLNTMYIRGLFARKV